MSAGLVKNREGQAMCMATNRMWHGEGYVRPDGFSALEAYQDMGDKVRYGYFHPINPFDGEEYKDRKIVIREDTNESIADVGPVYDLMQPEEFCSLVDEAYKQYGEARLLSFCILDKTRKMAATAELPGSNKGEKKLQSFGTSCDGTYPIWSASSRITIVCMNTYAACWGTAKGKNTMKHTTNWRDRVSSFVMNIRLADVELEAVRDFENALAEIQAGRVSRVEFLKELVPAFDEENLVKATANKRNDLYVLINAGRGSRDGSARDILSGVTEYESNKDRRTYGRKRNVSPQDKLIHNLYGGNRMELTGKAIDILAEKYEIQLPSRQDLVKLI